MLDIQKTKSQHELRNYIANICFTRWQIQNSAPVCQRLFFAGKRKTEHGCSLTKVLSGKQLCNIFQESPSNPPHYCPSNHSLVSLLTNHCSSCRLVQALSRSLPISSMRQWKEGGDINPANTSELQGPQSTRLLLTHYHLQLAPNTCRNMQGLFMVHQTKHLCRPASAAESCMHLAQKVIQWRPQRIAAEQFLKPEEMEAGSQSQSVMCQKGCQLAGLPLPACLCCLPCWHLRGAAEISHLKACIVSPTLPLIHRCSFHCAVFSMATALESPGWQSYRHPKAKCGLLSGFIGLSWLGHGHSAAISMPVQSILLLKIFSNHCVLACETGRKNDWRRIYTAHEKLRNRHRIK